MKNSDIYFHAYMKLCA